MGKTVLILVAIITILSNEIFSQEGWIAQSPPAETPSLSGVYSVDSLNIWAVGREGTIIHTTDGGLTWESIPNGAT